MINTLNLPLNDFEELSKSNPDQLFFIDFMASWCAPCNKIKPFIHELVNEFPGVNFYIVDTDDDERGDIVDNFNISALPTFILYKNGNICKSVLGIDESSIMNSINEFL